jgi:hypothetical protein
MARKVVLGIAASALICLGLAPAAGAATRTQLVLSQGAAFSILGHSCGGIQEKTYATGFGPGGFPQGDVYMKTSCGGSGRGGGYHTTTYTAWATVTWDWVGGTRSFAKLEGPASENTEFSAEDAHGDKEFNVGTSAFLETTSPPLSPPGTPTGVSAAISAIETAEETVLVRFAVSWTPAPETAALITSSTITATPVSPSTAPVLTTTVGGASSSGLVGPLQPYTKYVITVTNSDDEGTSGASTPIEAASGGPEGEPEEKRGGRTETCEQNQGTIKLSPGLEETPHVQSITVKGTLKGCDGPLSFSEGTYTAHLQTTEEVTCSTLSSVSAEPTTTSTSLAVKWSPTEAGKSTGTFLIPLTEVPGETLTGTLQGGALPSPTSFSASSLSESFTGGATCGVASGKKKAKAVKSGTFATSAVQIGE